MLNKQSQNRFFCTANFQVTYHNTNNCNIVNITLTCLEKEELFKLLVITDTGYYTQASQYSTSENRNSIVMSQKLARCGMASSLIG